MSRLRGAQTLGALCAILVSAAACSASKSGGGAGSLTSPSVTATAKLRTSDVLSGDALAGATISGSGLTTGTTDGTGSLTLTTTTASTYGIDVASAGYITRNTLIKLPGADAPVSLIKSTFDLTAFDEMWRIETSTNSSTPVPLRRWTSAPALRVVSRVMEFNNSGPAFTATDEPLTPGEIDTIVANMSAGLPQLTGGVLPSFNGVGTLSGETGQQVTLAIEGAITFARCRGLNEARGASGYAQILYFETTSVVTGAMICIDREFDRSNSTQGLAVRLHELGHALGALHVFSRPNVLMTPMISVTEIQAWDRDASKIAYQRPPGSRTPDRDPSSFSTNNLRLRTLTLDECRVRREP